MNRYQGPTEITVAHSRSYTRISPKTKIFFNFLPKSLRMSNFCSNFALEIAKCGIDAFQKHPFRCSNSILPSRRNGFMSFRGEAKYWHKRRLLTLFATTLNLRNIWLMVVAVSNECPRDMQSYPSRTRFVYVRFAYSAWGINCFSTISGDCEALRVAWRANSFTLLLYVLVV